MKKVNCRSIANYKHGVNSQCLCLQLTNKRLYGYIVIAMPAHPSDLSLSFPSTSLFPCVSRLFRAVRFDKGKYDVNIKTTGKSSPEFAPYPTHSAKKDAERQTENEKK